MNRTILRSAVGLLGVIATCGSVQAATYAFTTDSAIYTVANGDSQVVRVYLKETGPVGSASIAAQSGLLGVGYAVNRGATGQSTITAFAPNTTSFNTSTAQNQTTINAMFKGQIPFSAMTGPSPDANGLIDLGTITITTSGLTSTTFTIGDYGTGTQTGTVDGGANTGSLDGQIAPGTFAVTVTAVPEPVSLAAVALGFAVVLRRRREAV